MGFLRSQRKETTFSGKPVHYTIKPIEYGDFLKIEQNAGDHSSLLSSMIEVVRKYVTLTVPPKADDGSDITIEDVCAHPYFLDLMREMFSAVVATGKVDNPLV